MSSIRSESASRRPRQKGTLFCPSCRHESPVGGDWRVRTTPAGDRFDCPVCGETLVVRPHERHHPDSHEMAGGDALGRLAAWQLTVLPRLVSAFVRLRRRDDSRGVTRAGESEPTTSAADPASCRP